MLQLERSRVKHRVSEFYTVEEIAEILAAIRATRGRCRTVDRFHDVVAFLFLTGARLGELAHLQVRMIDLQRDTLKIPQQEKSGQRITP